MVLVAAIDRAEFEHRDKVEFEVRAIQYKADVKKSIYSIHIVL